MPFAKKLILFVASLMAATVVFAQEATDIDIDQEQREGYQEKSFSPSKKKTVCSITINSDEEVNTFKKHLKGFDFVELVPNSKKGKKNWLSRACEKGIQCDVLIVSGHFGGRFFGKSGHSLSTTLLEEKSCDSKCSGILQRPKEVFLMGCNTLAGKEKDHRTPQEYVRVLIEDGFSRREAEEIAAFRYSPIGSDMRARMRNIFAGVEKIYGFDSVGPSGKTVQPILERYLEGRDYEKHLGRMTPMGDNKDLAHELRYSAFTQTTGRMIGKKERRPICLLNDKNIPGYKKTNWMVNKLKDENTRLKYIPHFSRLLQRRKKQGYKWSQAELQQLEDLKNNPEVVGAFNSLIKKNIPGMLQLQIDIAKLMKDLRWLDKKAYKKKVADIILDTGLDNNISIAVKDLICSTHIQADIPRNSLPQGRWSKNLISTLGCLKPQSEEVHLALVKAVYDSDFSVQWSFRWALDEIRPKSEKVHLALVKALSDPSADVRSNAARALWEVQPRSEKVHLALARALFDSDKGVRDSAKGILWEIRPKSEKVHLALVKALSDPSAGVRISAADTLLGLYPKSEKVHLALAKALSDPDKNVRNSAASALGEIRPKSEKVHLALAKALSDPDKNVRNSAASALDEIRPKSEKVHLALEKALSDPDKNIRNSAASALGKVKPKSEKAHLALAKALLDSSTLIRIESVRTLGKVKPKSEKVHLALVKALADSDDGVRREAVRALRKVKSQSKRVHLALVKALFDSSIESVRYGAADILGEIKPQSKGVHLALIKALSDPEELVRNSAASALGEIKPQSKKVHLALVKALSDPNKSVRYRAADILGEIKPQSKKVHLTLAKALSDPDKYVRDSAASALGKIKPQSKRVHLALTKALSDPDEWVRSSAASALWKINPQSEKFHLALVKNLSNENHSVRKMAAEGLKRIKPKSTKVYLSILSQAYINKIFTNKTEASEVLEDMKSW